MVGLQCRHVFTGYFHNIIIKLFSNS